MPARARPPLRRFSSMVAAVVAASGSVPGFGADPAAPPSDDRDRRIAASIAVLRDPDIDGVAAWVPAVRELAETGGPAVPALCDELDRTTGQLPLRSIAFTLRAAGDPRAVPALIRAIPRANVESGSDFGGLGRGLPDVAFMQKHDLDEKDHGFRGFSFGRPVREVFGALERLTGQKFDEEELYFVRATGGERSRKLQRRLFDRTAERWAAWWEGHWREFTDDPAYAGVGLPPFGEEIPPDPFTRDGVTRLFPVGPAVRESYAMSGAILGPPPAGLAGYYRTFKDLDTGRDARWPKELPPPGEADGGRVREWAGREGIDLWGVDHVLPGGGRCWALKGVGLKAWQVEEARWDTIAAEMKAGEPAELDRPADDLLMHVDPSTGRHDPDRKAVFLFVTGDGGCGVLRVKGQVSGRPVVGAPSSPDSLAGFYDGVMFDLKVIYEEEPGEGTP